jgi:hypothetical protein
LIRDLTAYERAMREAIERDIPTILALDRDVVDSPLSSVEYAVMKTGDATRDFALTLLASAADSHRDPLARARIVESMERIRLIPNPEPPPPPPPPVKATRLRINTMEPGVRYRVVQSFETFDGDTIDEGLVLTFQGYSYFPYDGGYTIQFVERGFRLAEISAANDRVLTNEDNAYFAPVDD